VVLWRWHLLRGCSRQNSISLAASLTPACARLSTLADAFAEQEALPQLARTALLQARIAAATGDIAAAQHLCDQALDIAQGQGLLDLKYRCDYLLGQIAEQRADLEAAARYYDRAIAGIDEVQNHLVLDERTSFLEDKGNIYQRAIILALRQGSKDQALIYVEKAKSRVIGDYLRNNIDIRLRAGDKAGEAILEDLAKLREEQAWYSSVVYEAENEVNLSDTVHHAYTRYCACTGTQRDATARASHRTPFGTDAVTPGRRSDIWAALQLDQ